MIDYKNFDTLTVQVKTNKKDEILKYYSLLGWNLFDEKDNSKYEDLFNLTFIRPHKIKNKDDLQLEQINLENKLNEIGKLEKYRHAKTNSVVLSLSLIMFSLLAIGLWLVLEKIGFGYLITGLMMFVAGAVLLVLQCIFVPKMHKKEENSFYENYNKLRLQIEEILSKVKCLQVNDE